VVKADRISVERSFGDIIVGGELITQDLDVPDDLG
jgi:hypothetical protein